MQIFAEFLSVHGEESKFGLRMEAAGEQLSATSPSLLAALHPKASETLRKRASSLRALSLWLRSAGVRGNPFDEATMFEYFGMLIAERSAPSRGLTVRQLIGFMGGVFGFPVQEALESARVKGLGIKLRERRGILRQAAPLTVAMVEQLERLVLESPDDGDIALAGLALFALLARCRVGDLRRCSSEPVLDLSPDQSCGFVETVLEKHKTARPGHRQLLPAVAPAFGVLGREWASAWLSARRRLGLNATAAGTLVQAPLLGGGWSAAPLKTAEFAGMVRLLLVRAGTPQDQLRSIGSHSLKVTTLAWASKFGVPREDRRILGYHLKAGDRTMEAYSRDSQAAPLRRLVAMLREVGAKRFLPDATRSGQLVAPQPDSSSGSSSAACSESSEGPAEDGGEAEQEVGGALERDRFLQNSKTKRVHIFLPDDSLSCCRAVPVTFSILDELPPAARLCRDCF